MPPHRLHVVYIRPSKYDDDGYVMRFWRGVLPSNTLACLEGLTRTLAEQAALGSDVALTVDVFDDTVQHIPIARLARMNRRPDTRVVVGFAGVQSNQFCRAGDLALELRAAGVPVMIGGFHVSGMLALFGEPTPDLQRLLDGGVTLVKGEAEAPGVLEQILRDALHDEMKPIYDIQEFPDLTSAPVPRVNTKLQRRFLTKQMATIDTSRGCPFNCSFCTIINVQGRKMRYRSADCVLKAIDENYANGISVYFFTDDNFSRNPVWEDVFNGLIARRERGMNVIFMMQIDTQAHKIPGFVEKAARAGCYLTFIGMESVNQKNLAAIGKKQNHVDQYGDMVDLWHRNNVQVHVGYIIGLPHDSRESIRQDMEVLLNQVRVDIASLFMLTPLPGSKDHWRMVQEGVPMDADFNNFDSQHETFRHPCMAPGEWRASYNEAMRTLYSTESIVNALLRAPRSHRSHIFWTSMWYRYCAIENVHPMSTGFLRLKDRRSRRPFFAQESIASYAWRRAKDAAHDIRHYLELFFEFQEIWMLTRKPEDPRWKTLAEIRARWALARQRIMECDPRGRYDEAAQEVRLMLTTLSENYRQLSRRRTEFSFLMRKRLQRKAREAENYLRQFELQAPRWHDIVNAERYIGDRIVAGYEELAIRYVAKRRRFNAWRHDFVDRIRTGHILPMDLGRAVYAAAYEFVFAVRFGLGVLKGL